MPARGGNHRSSGAIFFLHEAPASVSGGPQVPRGGVVGPGRVLGRGFDPVGPSLRFGSAEHRRSSREVRRPQQTICTVMYL